MRVKKCHKQDFQGRVGNLSLKEIEVNEKKGEGMKIMLLPEEGESASARTMTTEAMKRTLRCSFHLFNGRSAFIVIIYKKKRRPYVRRPARSAFREAGEK